MDAPCMRTPCGLSRRQAPRSTGEIMLFQKLTEIAARAPGTSGIIEAGTFHSYSSMLEPIERLASGLLERGIGHGSAVALLMPNSADLFITAHALFAVGAIAVPLNPGAS